MTNIYKYGDNPSKFGALKDPVTGQPIAPANSGLGNQPATSTPRIQPTASAPPISGALNANENPPVSDGAATPEVGGAEPPFDALKERGMPEDKIRGDWRARPEDLVGMSEGAAQRVLKLDEVGQAQAKQMTKAFAAQGADPAKALAANLLMGETEIDRSVEDGKLSKSVGQKLKSRLKNAYKIIPEDQMGLFLIDFGLRAMMAGETMGSAAAIGSAGIGALGAMQERNRYGQEQAIEAGERERTAGLEEREMQVAERDSALGGETMQDTEGYVMEEVIGPNGERTWNYAQRSDGKGGTERFKAVDSDAYKGEKDYVYKFGKSIGKTDEEIWSMWNGDATENDMRDFYEKLISNRVAEQQAKLDEDPMSASLREQFQSRRDDVINKPFYEFTAEDKQRWVDAQIKQRRRSKKYDQYGSALGNAE